MKKLAVMMALVFALLAGSAFAAQERPNERGQGNRMHDRGVNDRVRGRRIHRRYRRGRRHHVIEHRGNARRGEGNHRPPTP
jgi:hypothetical protein